jgi:hypothetical protein
MLATVLIAVATLGIVEVAVLHIIVRYWSPVAAFVLTAIGLLASVYMIGLAKSLRYMPTVLRRNTLVVRLGHLLVAEIPYSAIEAVRTIPPGTPAPSECLNMAAMSSPNLLIAFANGHEATGLFGRRRGVRQVAVRMDDADSFRVALSERLELTPKATAL